MAMKTTWDEEAEVVVVGYGGAGAVAAITAHDAGARVLILEKQPSDTPTRTRHTPATRISGGGCLSPLDWEKATLYFEGMVNIANETLDDEYKEIIRIFAQYSVENTEWLTKIGVEPAVDEGAAPGLLGRQVSNIDFPDLPGSECALTSRPATIGNHRNGAALFKGLSEAVDSRNIPVMWETPAVHLVAQGGGVLGVIARQGAKEVRLRASRAVILTCGGFEFNEWMKENYLRVTPVHFYGNPGNTGDGINMVMELGAALWHMNAAAFRVTMKFPEFPVAFGTQRHEIGSILVDRRGRRLVGNTKGSFGLGD